MVEQITRRLLHRYVVETANSVPIVFTVINYQRTANSLLTLILLIRQQTVGCWMLVVGCSLFTVIVAPSE